MPNVKLCGLFGCLVPTASEKCWSFKTEAARTLIGLPSLHGSPKGLSNQAQRIAGSAAPQEGGKAGSAAAVTASIESLGLREQIDYMTQHSTIASTIRI